MLMYFGTSPVNNAANGLFDKSFCSVIVSFNLDVSLNVNKLNHYNAIQAFMEIF
jgi:hypothetical protein